MASGKVAPSPGITTIIEEAMAGEFHDFKNNKYPCGKVAANGMLVREGLVDLAKRLREGEFDEAPDEEDKANMRKELEGDPNGQALIKLLGL